MPPSHHSSSHHSSSHHSSSHHSHHSSSHHSSFRSSRSFSSGPSRHSSSSYSSGPSRHSNSSYTSRPLTPGAMRFQNSRSTAPVRTRINQPRGYRGSKRTVRYVCTSHEYIYYPESWQDESTGMTYEKGYYDENGNRYNAIAFSDNGSYLCMLTCGYCGTEIKAQWNTGAAPYCPNCGASMNLEVGKVATDNIIYTSEDEEEYNNHYSAIKRKQTSTILITVVLIVVFLLMPCLVVGIINGIHFLANKDNREKDRYEIVNERSISGHEDEIYVSEIDRTCKYYDEYESYYDKKTDCYFWYNDESSPAQWQYWYEGISSDYGDYGWMEYDEYEECWYIEKSAGNWIKLPSKYDTSKLWHIEEESMSEEDTIYVEEINRYCDYYPEYESYYDEETDCYFWYNEDVSPAVWQYWYEGISSDYGDYGWMEYNENENKWYIEVKDGEWKSLPSKYDTDSLWHIDD